MGIFDDVLCPHLKTVTEVFRQHRGTWLQLIEDIRTDELQSEQKAELEHKLRLEAAESFREEGNNWFKEKSFCEAASSYTDSISSAKEGPLAALAYFNRLIFHVKINLCPYLTHSLTCGRSAALFHMNFYEDCIKDIDRALASGYPKLQNLYNLHLRKAKCLKFLKKDHLGCLADATKVLAPAENT
jgi:hypothetical protein